MKRPSHASQPILDTSSRTLGLLCVLLTVLASPASPALNPCNAPGVPGMSVSTDGETWCRAQSEASIGFLSAENEYCTTQDGASKACFYQSAPFGPYAIPAGAERWRFEVKFSAGGHCSMDVGWDGAPRGRSTAMYPKTGAPGTYWAEGPVDGKKAWISTYCGSSGPAGAGSGTKPCVLSSWRCQSGTVVPTSVVAGQGFSCATFSDGNVKCWGAISFGSIDAKGFPFPENRGDGPDEMGKKLPVINLGKGKLVSSLVAGGSHICALLTDGEVKCFGANHMGQLGLGDTDPRTIGTDGMGDNLPAVDLGAGEVVQLAAGLKHTCARFGNGEVKCWGSNERGQLGVPAQTGPNKGVFNRGSKADQMGTNLPAIDFGPGKTAIELAAGDNYSCVILDGGEVKCWGGNQSGQLGIGKMEDWGDAEGEMGAGLPAVKLGDGKVIQLTAGVCHTCALFDNGKVKCWGDNCCFPPASAFDNPDALDPDDMPVCCGKLGLDEDVSFSEFARDTTGRLSRLSRVDAADQMGTNLPWVPLGSLPVTAVSAGSQHTCVQFSGGKITCWGQNRGEELGLGQSERARGTAANPLTPEVLVDIGSVQQMAAGGNHTCALLETGQVKCWGNNNQGQLGLGDTRSRGGDPNDMGANLPAVDLEN